jgi:hypothetical protein
MILIIEGLFGSAGSSAFPAIMSVLQDIIKTLTKAKKINHIRLLVLPAVLKPISSTVRRETPTTASCFLGDGRKTNKGKRARPCGQRKYSFSKEIVCL